VAFFSSHQQSDCKYLTRYYTNLERRNIMDVYQVINSRIMELLEQGTVPWRKTWNAQSNYPKNLISGKKYQGINVFILACQQHSSPWWLTFKQVQDKGGHVVKGSKSTPIIFYKWLDKKDSITGVGSEESLNGKIPLLRYYSVFNIEQTEGITPPPAEETHNHFDPITKAEEIIANDLRVYAARSRRINSC
jgi:antirestriction protein ArdC